MRNWRALSVAIAVACCFIGSATQARADGLDCPFVGELPNFKPDPAVTWIRYDERTMYDKSPHQVRGKICKQHYAVKQGTDPMSPLEVNENYKDQLTQEGVEITNNEETCKIWGRVIKDGKTTWIQVICGPNNVDVTTLEETPMPQLMQPVSGQDYRLIGHILGYEVDKATKINFDQQDFQTHKGTVNVRGVKYQISYVRSKNAPPASAFEVYDNYRDALTAMGAEIIYGDNDETDNRVTARLEDGGKTVWIQVYGWNNDYNVIAVEEKPFVSTIKPPDAAEMKTAIESTGRMVLYINFDFNKASPKPDAAPIIAQIVQLLKDNPDLKVSIEGHTDAVGLHDYNVKLSQGRAAAVVTAVTTAGIDGARLSSQGFGPDKPIAPNDTEDGRAKNRRVELVKQ